MWHIIRNTKNEVSRSTHSKIPKLVDQIPCTHRRIRHGNRAILTQPGDDGMDYLIIYSSRKLNKAKRNYSTIEREALGMFFALQKYWHYLLANPFIFYTDHQALKYLVNKPLNLGRICRWLLLFQEFKFEVIVRLGKLNVRPDHLSRIDIGEELTGVKDDLPNTHLF